MQRTWGICLASLAAMLVVFSGCDDKKGAGDTASSAAAKPKAPLDGKCQKNEDCVSGHGCADNKTCQTYKTIECRGRGDACKREGMCTGDGKRCVAGTDADCKASKICDKEARCTAKNGLCIIGGAEDCKPLCAKFGRCTFLDNKCVADKDDDCAESEACKKYSKCKASKAGDCYDDKPRN
ncbi:MAG: hypothetical protein JRI68_02230 [Deltaproteobacteria bacterium]|nr:hypothetical protein [Deltaproteobacteria bacterium]